MKLGYVDVDRMLSEISFRKFLEWRAYADLEPFDETRDDIRFASINQTMVNMWRNTKKRPAPYPLADFVLKFGDSQVRSIQAPTKTWQQLKAIGQHMADAYKARP